MKKSLFGYGGTIKAIAKSGDWDIYDDKFNCCMEDEFGNKLLPASAFDPSFSELEITSPGIAPNNELIKKARNLISEYDFFASKMPFNIWISGTNGKTTTTKMMQHLLEKFGSQMGGNVGTPLADLSLDAKIWILETSSFTIHYTNVAKPDIYVLLPVTPDHLSWHGNFNEYEKSKLKPFGMMSENGVIISPKIYAKTPTKAHVISYENEFDLAKFCNINIDDIKFKTPFLTDALLALCVEKILLDRCDVELLNKFIIENNKLEELYDKSGRLWVNDTKATNIDATIQALKRYENHKIHIILGGDDKGVDMNPVFEVLSNVNAEIYAIGSNTNKMVSLANKFNITVHKCEFLQNAVNEISKNMQIGEVGLLSPACASIDQFKSYAERGDKFKEFIANFTND
ncbi:UDP-N-acetylmuramoyl-L-alanine--D-glutamate ligase [Campylobacter sp. RM13119]|uniref:UDP-N-acetylmuramoyl-L-alanine--D-glutamate ligase n=1 Tax=Campylobacter TaxID=194 RepID=UPI001474D3D6|nr:MULTISPECIES: UDP-N-acetylmuramoyl-L-alanine--D-glutamate ligase [unclassified Campylobacter]MBE3606126.1 UDP-N-acetylmuramoyl-L-alanine--D-glutamate ligase [Campylobacter sp. RM13119]MBE3609438.1 UDP-N-acetylmuramoyl-L-alanine--D-glutamate ligase [Campylobacter sp. RM12916]